MSRDPDELPYPATPTHVSFALTPHHTRVIPRDPTPHTCHTPRPHTHTDTIDPHTRTHTPTHTYIHTYTRAHTHIYIHTHTLEQTHTWSINKIIGGNTHNTHNTVNYQQTNKQRSAHQQQIINKQVTHRFGTDFESFSFYGCHDEQDFFIILPGRTKSPGRPKKKFKTQTGKL